MQDAHSGGVGQCLFPGAFVLLRFEVGIGLRWMLLGVMHRAIRFGANLPQFALVDAVRDDCFGDVPARFELRPLRLLRCVGLVRPDFDVLAAGNNLAAILLHAVGRADLDKLRLGCNLFLNVRLQLRGVAGWIGASVRISAHIGKEQFVVSGTLGASDSDLRAHARDARHRRKKATVTTSTAGAL